MKIAIHGRAYTIEVSPYINQIFSELNNKGIEIFVSDQFALHNQAKSVEIEHYPTFTRGKFPKVDFVLSLGGDGTLLETVTYVGRNETPIIGINTGRLGFLATIAKTEIDKAFDEIFLGNYKIDERTLLHLNSEGKLFNHVNCALNEFAILKKDTSSMINVRCFINGEFLNSYWADGLMVATPTGSTGYNLSCGGPVVFPRSENFIITPVSPHNLNIRPLIVSDNSIISFEIETRGKKFLASLDSRSETVQGEQNLSVRKEDFKAKLVILEGYNFLNTLRNKLNWGLDLRN